LLANIEANVRDRKIAVSNQTNVRNSATGNDFRGRL